MKRCLYWCSILCLAGLVLAGCQNKSKEQNVIVTQNPQEEEVSFNLWPVKRGNLMSEVGIECSYNPREKIECAFTGTKREVLEVSVKEGETVTKGQVLARQDVEEYEEELAYQQHVLQMAETRLANTQEMLAYEIKMLDQEFGYVDEEDRDMAAYNSRKKDLEREYGYDITDLNDEITIAKMRIEENRKKVNEGTLYSPVDGVVVLSRTSMIGSVSDPKTSVVNLIKEGDLTFISKEIDKAEFVQVGQEYDVLVGKGESQKTVKVMPVDSEAWEEEIYFEVVTPDLQLERGSKGQIWIQMEERKNVLYLPIDAVHQIEDKYYVYTVTEDGFRDIKYITVGKQSRDSIEIVEGLSEGEYVITNTVYTD